MATTESFRETNISFKKSPNDFTPPKTNDWQQKIVYEDAEIPNLETIMVLGCMLALGGVLSLKLTASLPLRIGLLPQKDSWIFQPPFFRGFCC